GRRAEHRAHLAPLVHGAPGRSDRTAGRRPHHRVRRPRAVDGAGRDLRGNVPHPGRAVPPGGRRPHRGERAVTRRYLALWWRLLRLCYANEPRITMLAWLTRLLFLVTIPLTAVTLRAAVDSAVRASGGHGTARAATLAAVAVAAAYTANTAVERMA